MLANRDAAISDLKEQAGASCVVCWVQGEGAGVDEDGAEEGEAEEEKVEGEKTEDDEREEEAEKGERKGEAFALSIL